MKEIIYDLIPEDRFITKRNKWYICSADVRKVS